MFHVLSAKQKGGAITPPSRNTIARWLLGIRHTGAPHIYAGEQEQPHHVDEMPIPGGKLEAEMLLGIEVAGQRADQADDEEDRADDHMGAVEAGRHEEGGAVDVAFEAERRVRVFVGLHAGEGEPEQDGQRQAPVSYTHLTLPTIYSV